jgi:RsiW-degrading membrane proteinase PrsW (M82 family)
MNIIVSILPVFLLLITLIFFDSFKLVKWYNLAVCTACGAAAAILSYFLNTILISLFQSDFSFYAKYISPELEELLKAIIILIFIRIGKIGFAIDGAILGFAVGAGFSLVENSFYLASLPDQNILIWIVRGFGTAIMHGGATSIMTVTAMFLTSRKDHFSTTLLLPGLAFGIVIHALYNQFLVPPLISTAALFFIVPATMIMLFNNNEKSLRQWLEFEFDSEAKLLLVIKSGKFSESRLGSYFLSVKDRFPREIIVDMLAYIQLYLELSIKAKAILMLQEQGFPVLRDPDIDNKLKELEYLRHSIGKTGLLALSPILRMSRKDLWKINLLQK